MFVIVKTAIHCLGKKAVEICQSANLKIAKPKRNYAEVLCKLVRKNHCKKRREHTFIACTVKFYVP